MEKVILICGKLCSGKTTYAKRLCREQKAALLSVDALMLAMLDPYLGDQHEVYAERAKTYLLKNAVELCSNGIRVILDWGFWRREERNTIRAYLEQYGIKTELHYLWIEDELWHSRIAKRNQAVLDNAEQAYYVDSALMEKFLTRFEEPDEQEITLQTT